MQKRIKAAMGDLRLRGTRADLWAKIRSFLQRMKHQVNPVWVVHLCFKELVCLWKFVLGFKGRDEEWEERTRKRIVVLFLPSLCHHQLVFKPEVHNHTSPFFQLLFWAKVLEETSISCFKLMLCDGLIAFPHARANHDVKKYYTQNKTANLRCQRHLWR